MSNNQKNKRIYWTLYNTFRQCDMNKHEARRSVKQLKSYFEIEHKKDNRTYGTETNQDTASAIEG